MLTPRQAKILYDALVPNDALSLNPELKGEKYRELNAALDDLRLLLMELQGGDQ